MSQQALDLRRFLQTVRRYRNIVGFAAALGLVAGAVFTVLNPPMLASKALVALPPDRAGLAANRLHPDPSYNREQRPRPGECDATVLIRLCRSKRCTAGSRSAA